MIMIIRMHLEVVLYLSIFASCCCQSLLFSCDFDSGLNGPCQFTNTPGAPVLDATTGTTSNVQPTQPLSDVTSVSSLTTPNNEPCELPHIYPPDTWPTYFCRSVSSTNYTCMTATGLGNCVIGRYGLMKTNRSGFNDHTYTTISTVQNARNAFQCLDLYYYLTDTSNDAKISVGWTAGMGPFPIEEVRAELDNKWQHSRTTYATPAAPVYSLWFQIRRDSGNAGFSFALDEINVFDGSCESPTTAGPPITSASPMTSQAATAATWGTIKITTEKVSLATTATNFEQTTQPNPTDTTRLLVTSSSTERAASLTSAMQDGNQTDMPSPTTQSTIVTALFSDFASQSSAVTNTPSDPLPSTTPVDITSIQTLSTTTSGNPISQKEAKLNLPLIFGLAFGVGLPLILFSILGLGYYCQVVKGKPKVAVHTSDDTELLEVPVKRSTRRVTTANSVIY